MKNLEKLEEDIMKYWNACKTPEEALEIVNYIISHPSAKWEPLIHASWGGAGIKNKQVFEAHYDEIMSSWATASADEDGLVCVPEE